MASTTAITYALDANGLVISVPEKTDFHQYQADTVKEFKAKTPLFTSELTIRNYKVSKLAAADYLKHLESDATVRCAIPELLRNANDHSKPYHQLGLDTKAIRVFMRSGIDLLKAAGPSANMAELYSQWERDFLAREHIAFIRGELASYESFLQRKRNPRWEAPASLLEELHWVEWEHAFLKGALKRLEEVRRFDDIGIPKQQYLAPLVPVSELPDIPRTEFWTFSPAAVQAYRDRTRPYSLQHTEKDRGYKVELLTVDSIRQKWEKNSLVASQRPDILQNAADRSKAYDELGNTTKSVRVFLFTGLERLKQAPAGASLADIYGEWERDFLARELPAFVRGEQTSYEIFLKQKAHPAGSIEEPLLKESHWVEYEKVFLRGVLDRLLDIRNEDQSLVRARDDAARREQEKAKAEAQKAAKEAERLKQLEEEKAAKLREEEKKREKEEEEKKREKESKEKEAAQLAAAANAVAATQNKAQLYQAEMAQLQQKMMKGEIDGATFGAQVGALSKKYFG